MASEYKYDEESETWPYFVLALLVFALLPLTYRYVSGLFARDRPAQKPAKGALSLDHQALDLPHSAQISKLQFSLASSRVFNKKLVFVVAGWALVAYIWTTYAQEVSLQGFFDPYTILEVPYTATEREIKTRYRMLSLTFHPDKIAKDLSDAAKKEMEEAYIRIGLAYKALTDEATKENLRLYGHPDGPQDISHGIAIPKFLVEGKYSSLMIVVYFLLIGVVLPLVVGTWWNNVKSVTKKGLYVDTATFIVHQLTDRVPGKVFTPFDILDWMLQAGEITLIRGNLTVEQTRALVLEYLARDFSGDNELLKLKVVAKLPELIKAFIEIATVFRVLDVVIAAYDLQKAIYQASSPVGKHKELLQLPYVDQKTVEAQPIKKIGKLLTLSKDESGKVLGIKDPKKLEIALSVANKIPFFKVLDASFKVPGESTVAPNSSTHLVLKFLVKSAAFKSCPKVEESRLSEEETFEDMKDPLRSNKDAPLLPQSYAPYFPQKLASSWECFIVNQKDSKFIENSEAASLDKVDFSNLELTQEQWIQGKEDTLVISTFKIKITLAAPPETGLYHFRLLMKSNSYFGNDVDIPLELNVVNQPVDMEAVKRAASQENSDDDSDSDISDPEEDSIAGALAAMRGQKVKKANILGEEIGESDNESIFTDINTDTEDEKED
ncbi:hypothetical protein METBIDRAFT_38221 [Metschnikowia bicuspidata var. bicuspidata NRRL YB-4993]|uniref:J domain-containing protein n=1 Tax=Metschnikowia bicuspidata var. bicuspidata NRRL YB-4993 TaxID=869754 RepID=A0A1A0HKW0_9ASCO|nr:hypothetical protein METBIDRAFT_38221 [Metschnikowia bicuspidata var. bicuspidata NRRL YB-4993]OBA24443.1 hypothetical protein METBIDRAFT_38221 [Metschnikowia bicuspidata var. bicuspidata NRRL YB-4993]